MPVKYIPYYPETIDGQAILDNFVRTRRMLRYKDSDKVGERLRRGMPLYEVEELEKVNGGGESLVIRGECVSACAYLKDKGIKVDLVYIDPPFASGADYAKKIYLRKNPVVAEALAAGNELEDDELKAFEEKMYGDIWDKEQYLNWMFENLTAIRSVMSETASIYVHLDYHIGHYVKILLDEVFGEDNFRNEIIWKRSTAHSDSSGFANLHDAIYYYTFSEDSYFEVQFDPYTDDYVKTYYRHKDEKGVFLDRDLSAKGLKGRGYNYSWKGKAGYWRCPIETMKKYDEENRLYYTATGTPRYKQYFEEMEGTPLQDLWTNVYAVNSQAQERVDYATQKPAALLERIVNASSGDGMVVADFFGGSGVTAKVANRLGRVFISNDVGVNSLQAMRDGLSEAGAKFDVIDIKDGVSLFRNPAQTMDRLKGLIQGLRNEDKLDSFWEGAIEDSKKGLIPVYVPNLLDHSSKVLDIPAMNRIINEAMPDLPDDVAKVIVYYIDIENKADLDRFIKEQNETNVEIELRDLKEVLDNVVLGDSVEYEVSKLGNEYQVDIKGFVSDRLVQKIDEFNQKRELQMQKKRQPLLEVAEIGEVEDEPDGGFKEIAISENGLELIEMISLDCTNSKGSWKADSEIRIDKNSLVIRDGKKTKEFWDGKLSAKKKPKRLKVRNIAGDESIVDL